jgi:hypothetical protein
MYSVPPRGSVPRSTLWRPRSVTAEGRVVLPPPPPLQPGPLREVQVAGKGVSGRRGAGTQFCVRRPLLVAEVAGMVWGVPPSIFHMESVEWPDGEGDVVAEGVGVVLDEGEEVGDGRIQDTLRILLLLESAIIIEPEASIVTPLGKLNKADEPS